MRGKFRSLETLIIGAATDKPRPQRPVQTAVRYCEWDYGCTNVAVGWRRREGRNVPICGRCQGREAGR